MASTYTSNADLLNSHALLHRTFKTGLTKSLQWRKWQLKQIWWLVIENEPPILEALRKDLHRDEYESKMMDLYAVKTSVLEALEKLERWAGETIPKAGFLFGTLGKARIRKEPLGVALILGTWNFPIALVLQPLIAAISAGCCVLVKPSELAVHSQNLITDLITQYLDQSAIRVVTGGSEEAGKVLELNWNQVFYTGSGSVGRIVAKKAAENLTPIVLELGGQGAAIVDGTADVDVAAKRIASSKFINCGQICLAVNHVFVDPTVHDEFVARLAFWFESFSSGSTDQYARIINERNFDRLESMLRKTSGEITYGGKMDKKDLFIQPTVVTHVDIQDSLMKEEIFGPLLPVIQASYIDAYKIISSMDHPLGLYIFSKSQAVVDEILDNTNSGGVTINDIMVHSAVANAPFGGVGGSGYGAYHGEYGFLSFSHQRTVVSPPGWLERLISFRYPPYDLANLSRLRIPAKVTFNRGETMQDQKIGKGGFF